MSALATERVPTAGRVSCVYHLTGDDTVWTVIGSLSRARLSMPEAADGGFDVILVAAPDVRAETSWDVSVLQQLPSVLSLLKFVRGYSVFATIADAEPRLAYLAGTIICHPDLYDRLSGLTSNSHVLRLPCTSDVSEVTALKHADLAVSPVAYDFIDNWLVANDANRRVVTITIDRTADHIHVARNTKIVGDWANEDGRIVVLIDQRTNAPQPEGDRGEAFRNVPGVDQNIELRVALYGRSLINVFIGSEHREIALPPMDRAALVLGAGATADSPDSARVLPLAAAADGIRNAMSAAAALSLDLTEKGQNQFGEKQMTASVEEFYLVAVKLLQSGGERVAKSIEILKKILLKDPKHADSWALLGLAAHFFKKHRDAEGLLKSAIALNPDDPAYYFNLGNVYCALADYPNAIAAMTAALERDPGLFEAHDVLADIYREQKEFALALAHLDRSCELKERWRYSGGKRAECFFALGEPEQALECIGQYVAQLADNRENEVASAVMVWPWCAKLYASRDALFLTDYRQISMEERPLYATAE